MGLEIIRGRMLRGRRLQGRIWGPAIWSLAMLWLAAFALLHSPSAEAAPVNDDAIAVIIGNKTYDGSIPEVSFAHNDADAFRQFVIDGLGYREGNIIDLRDATYNQMVTVFGNKENHEGKLFDYIRPGESDVTVFYSGHGVPGLKDRQAYLLPSNGDPNRAELSGYPIATLYKNLNKLPARTIRVFIDACFSGETPKGMLVRSASGISVTPKAPKGSSRMVILTAAQGDQLASWDEDAKQGLFTKHLLEALYGAADGKKYGDDNGKVTLGEVGTYLKREMTYQARRRFGRVQEASLNGSDADVLAPEIVQQRKLASVVVAPKPKTPSPVKLTVDIYPRRNKPGGTFKDCETCPEMVVVPAGSFRMGDLSGRNGQAKPVHRVTIPEAFAVGRFEVTQAQWEAVMGNNPSRFKGSDKPVEIVSWDDAQEYIVKLNNRLGLSNRRDSYRLLSEAEWEYVARAGTSTKYHVGNSISKSQANYNSRTTVDVGQYPANAFGLHDVHGNVWEWVEDCWNRGYEGAPASGAAWMVGNCDVRVQRGGSWLVIPSLVRSLYRWRNSSNDRSNDNGFRVARTLSQKQVANVATVPQIKTPSPVEPAVGIHPQSYKRKPGDTFKDCDTCPEMIVIPKGSFQMGNLDGKGWGREKPVHRVNFSYSFAVGKFEITQAQWKSIMSNNPSEFKGNRRPVERVSWEEAQGYIKKLNARLGLTERNDRYRLLSESEWEYVARAGTESKYHFGNNITRSLANYSGSFVVDVGSYPPNSFGLHDVHGNVEEWTQDCGYDNYEGAPVDGSSWTSDNCGVRVLRGGGGHDNPWNIRSASRGWYNPTLQDDYKGFRVGRTLMR
jgi:formylglycine-generating enzyme required for sulfatase activity